ncbi:hypothetical protein BP422_25955 [Brevibacillus formosus]|uniref:Cell division protein FtsW n=1 Tax=Brevibacillus formosus TaxID=54913 RepID=A0A220MNY6_9BACL|nr:FtsW/RodA/SpoVE family cell cycle protein [Brevibacillus formosus]ASJ56682.1 hypothetical protein BP422_25955 [Brevibacillus formosus]
MIGNKRIAEMGDPVTVGQQLHQAHKPRMEWGILAIVGILLAVGLLVLYSLQVGQNEQDWLERQVNGILIGTIALVAILFSDYSKLKRYSRLLYVATLLLLLFTLSFGDPMNNIPHLDIRVEELNVFYISPFLLIVAIAGIFTQRKENGRFTIMKAVALFLPPCFLLLSVRQEYSIIMFLIGYVTLLIASQANWRAVLSFLRMSLSIIIGKYDNGSGPIRKCLSSFGQLRGWHHTARFAEGIDWTRAEHLPTKRHPAVDQSFLKEKGSKAYMLYSLFAFYPAY